MIDVSKEWLGVLSLALTLVGSVPYFRGMLRGKIKPHAFSWCIWGVLTAVAFFVQWSEGAGPGAWATAGTSVLCFAVAGMAVTKGERQITWDDWVVFIAALCAVPIWWVTDDALLSILWITAIDMMGYYPTFRKSWLRPHEEQMLMHWLGTVKQGVAILAMQQVLVTTVLYPAAIGVANLVLVGMIAWRRRSLARL